MLQGITKLLWYDLFLSRDACWSWEVGLLFAFLWVNKLSSLLTDFVSPCPLSLLCFSPLFSVKTMSTIVLSCLPEPHPASMPSWSNRDSLSYLVKYSRVSFIRPCQFISISNLFFLMLVRALTHLSPMFIVLAIWPHLSWLVKLKQKGT